jgi:hypothetical protein
MIYLAPDLLDNGLVGPTKSTGHFLNTFKVTCDINGISSFLDGFPTL